MKRYVTILQITILALFVIVAFSDDAHARTPLRKLGRGIANVATCFMEIPHQIMMTAEEEGKMAGWSVGLIKGVAMTGTRAVVGAYEICTFPIPVPKKYRPILRYPEFFFKREEF